MCVNCPNGETVGKLFGDFEKRLTLTIPSWSSSIDRVRKQTDLSIISAHAREGLAKQLQSLIDHVSDLLGAIKED